MKYSVLLGVGLAAVLLCFSVNLEIQAQSIAEEKNENGVLMEEVREASLNGGAISTIQPERIRTGSEKKEKFPIYTASYSSKETDCLEQTSELAGHCGVRIPIKLSEEGQVFIEFCGYTEYTEKFVYRFVFESKRL